MKKTKKTQSSNYNNIRMELPAILNMDTLAYAPDGDLEAHLSYLRSEKDRAARAEYDTQPWEVEICYVLRELQVRTDRRMAHERYLRSNPDANFYNAQAGH